MKNVIALLFFLTPWVALGQSGSIVYDQVVKIEIELPPEMESMRDKIPTESKQSKILYFTETASLMKSAPEAEKDKPVEVRGDGFMFRAMGQAQAENETYTNIEEGTVQEKRDFMGRTFLIGGDQPLLAWKLTGEASEYNGYVVHRATAVRDSTNIEAWFSPDIPVSAGPELFAGLPGMILVLSVDDGKIQYSATSINLDGVEEGLIRAPEKGKKVSRDEFDQIMKEKMEEMKAMSGGKGSRTIRIMNH